MESLWEKHEKIFRKEFEGNLLKEGHDGCVALMHKGRVVAVCKSDEGAALKKLELLGDLEECTLHDIGSAVAKSVLFWAGYEVEG